jgi:TfoX/Sxy family transcriptional regulator of competence genes
MIFRTSRTIWINAASEYDRPMKIPRPDQASIVLFKSLVPDDPQVTIRPMFGNISAFVNGNMFFGLFGNDLFVRLSDKDQAELLKKKGVSNLEPMTTS